MGFSILIETNEVGKEHIFDEIKNGNLSFLKLSGMYELGDQQYAFYFKRIILSPKSGFELRTLQAQLKLLMACCKFEYLYS